MYLNDLLAITSGNFYYGYRKLWGSFLRVDVDLAPSEFEASHLSMLKFVADITAQGSWLSSVDAESNLPNFNQIREIFTMPLIGRNPGSAPLLPYICSYFQWDFASAFVRPIKSRHQFMHPFTAATSPWVSLGELSSVKNGALAIRGMEFRISFPAFPCQF